MELEIKEKFLDLIRQVTNLEFSKKSIVELGSIKLEAERFSKTITDKSLKRFCINELEQLDTDEFSVMYSKGSESSFIAAKHELLDILKDCSNGKLNSK